MECFIADISRFLVQMPKLAFWVVGWVLVIKSKHFRNFLEILKFLFYLRSKRDFKKVAKQLY